MYVIVFRVDTSPDNKLARKGVVCSKGLSVYITACKQVMYVRELSFFMITSVRPSQGHLMLLLCNNSVSVCAPKICWSLFFVSSRENFPKPAFLRPGGRERPFVQNIQVSPYLNTFSKECIHLNPLFFCLIVDVCGWCFTCIVVMLSFNRATGSHDFNFPIIFLVNRFDLTRFIATRCSHKQKLCHCVWYNIKKEEKHFFKRN